MLGLTQVTIPGNKTANKADTGLQQIRQSVPTFLKVCKGDAFQLPNTGTIFDGFITYWQGGGWTLSALSCEMLNFLLYLANFSCLLSLHREVSSTRFCIGHSSLIHSYLMFREDISISWLCRSLAPFSVFHFLVSCTALTASRQVISGNL